MLFNVEEDRGDFVSGYIVCDGFVDTARITLSSSGAIVWEGLADLPREALVAAGRHRTGLCGFALDEARVPGLAHMADLEIRDLSSGALIYRRVRAHHVPKRVLRLETHLFPLWRLDNALNAHFQYSANQIEACGRETTMQMFLLNPVASVYLSGRLLYRSFQQYIEGHFDVVFSMHHPYEELAERLIVLAQIKKSGGGILGLRENMSLEPTMAFAQSLPVENERALARALRDIPRNVARVLANPVVRQLTTSSPEEMPTKSGVTAALTVLSSFAVVGLRRAPKTFAGALAEALGLDEPLPDNAALPGVTALAAHAQTQPRGRLADRAGPGALPPRRRSLSRRSRERRRFPAADGRAISVAPKTGMRVTDVETTAREAETHIEIALGAAVAAARLAGAAWADAAAGGDFAAAGERRRRRRDAPPHVGLFPQLYRAGHCPGAGGHALFPGYRLRSVRRRDAIRGPFDDVGHGLRRIDGEEVFDGFVLHGRPLRLHRRRLYRRRFHSQPRLHRRGFPQR